MVLVVPNPGVFIDPAAQQFGRTAPAWMPVSVPLPPGARFGDQAFAARRDDCDIIYEPQPEPIRVAAIWHHPLVSGSNETVVCGGGELLASMAFSMLRLRTAFR